MYGARAMALRKKASTSADMSNSSSSRDVPWRVWVLAALDLLLGTIYVVLASKVPSATSSFAVILGLMAAGLGAGALGLLSRRPWGWWLSLAGCGLVLVVAFGLMIVIASSLGYLAGSFGALGKGAAALGAGAVLLSVELFVLVPAFQVWWLLTPRGKAVAGRGAE
jgi:hypothetical protein